MTQYKKNKKTDFKNSFTHKDSNAGTAERLITSYGHNIRFCKQLAEKGWMVWDGKVWKEDSAAVWQYAKNTARDMFEEAQNLPDDEDENNYNSTLKKVLIKQCKKMLSTTTITQVLRQVSEDPRIVVDASVFDAQHHLFNTENGTFDTRTWEHREHRREDMLTKIAPVTYDENAVAERFNSFVEEMLPNENVRLYLQKAIGQALTGEIPEQAFYVNLGTGNNGKSTLFDTMLKLFGPYGGIIDLEALMERRQGQNAAPDLAHLKGKRLVVGSEIEDGFRLKSALVKKITGDEYISARDLFKTKMVFQRTHKLFMHVNYRPNIGDMGHAMWRRVRLIDWTEQPETVDKQLLRKLEQELPGILNWALDGLRMYQLEGLESPQEVVEATAGYKKDMDTIGQFIEDRCEEGPEHFTTKDYLYREYAQWCADDNMNPYSKRRFGEQMISRGFDPHQKEDKIRVWRGIGVVERELDYDKVTETTYKRG